MAAPSSVQESAVIIAASSSHRTFRDIGVQTDDAVAFQPSSDALRLRGYRKRLKEKEVSIMRARNAAKEANLLKMHPEPQPACQIVRACPLPPPFNNV
eukprot:4352081-Pleurochrysis_carterae.AAC.1